MPVALVYHFHLTKFVMPFTQITYLFCLLIFFVSDQASEYSSSSKTTIVEPTKEADATSIILQSKDGGQTWEDISHGLPEIEQRQTFFAGASELYLRTNGVLYRSRSD